MESTRKILEWQGPVYSTIGVSLPYPVSQFIRDLIPWFGRQSQFKNGWRTENDLVLYGLIAIVGVACTIIGLRRKESLSPAFAPASFLVNGMMLFYAYTTLRQGIMGIR